MNATLPSLASIRKAKAERRLADFVYQGWDVVEPSKPLEWNWHIDAICLHLEAVTRQQLWTPGHPDPEGGRIADLLINVPPGHMKSLLVSVFWPAWEWVRFGHLKSLFASYALDLAIRDSVRCRDLVTNDWYEDVFDPQWEMKSDQSLKGNFANTAGGFRKCLSIGSQATGYRGDKVVVDDSLNAQDAHSDAKRIGANEWWDGTMSTRVDDPRKRARVSIQQRLHTMDLTGHCLEKGGYEHLNLPTEYDPENATKTSIGYEDPRTQPGELLFPQYFTDEVIAKAKVDLGSSGFAGQHNQRPAPANGDVFKKAWLRFWVPAGVEVAPYRVELEAGVWRECPQVDLPVAFDLELQSWDCAFKDKQSSDPVCGQVWKKKDASAFLVDQSYGRMSFTATVKAVEALSLLHPRTFLKLIEDKANGTAVIDALTGLIPGLVPVEPQGGKVARAQASTPFMEGGNVYLPHPALFPWVGDLILELLTFPNAANDDRVDALTQAILRMYVAVAPPKKKAVPHTPPMSGGVRRS